MKNNRKLTFPAKNKLTNYFAEKVFSRIKKANYGQIEIILPNKQFVSHKGQNAGQNISIEFKTWKSFFQYVILGQLSFAEAYINGSINISNLSALFHWFVDNEKYFPEKQNNRYKNMINRFSHIILNDNNRSGSRKNISFHYDLGNNFYKKWLDETMTYSAGIFGNTKCLAGSQRAKYSRIVEQLKLKDGNSVLEIGCGWGGFAEHAISKHNINYRGITISNEQLDYTNKRLNKITHMKNPAIFEDYRDTLGTFDKIVSIEMFEAVGQKHWQSYFETIKNRLKPDGKAVIQVITIENDRYLRYQNRVDFIQKYIFPGGMLPSKQVFSDYAQKNQLKIDDEFAFGQDYVQTMRIWKDNFLQNWSEIESQGFDYRFYRLWLYYLDYCIAAFERNTIDVVQYSVVHDHA
ncbi:cyclopropane-fatty-acyl-phospholipid synthase family protein [Emcibacteraceae bacterium]|nr:cyclopropane-fatty-acyl-phospholipid synthase family protein [Emcibacteraceae bacterium]